MTNNLIIPTTIAFIQEAHKGQTYGNMPYFFHPVEVAATALEAAETLNRACAPETPIALLDDIVLAALLHDVIEDTKYTEEMLRERFSDAVVDMVVLLTSDPGAPYLDNIQKIIDSGNVGAMVVKLADNHVNRNGDKSSFTPERAKKLNDRYDASTKMLSRAIIEI
jgi:(p)ppGpp synthase/HD superfamily hydrolase